jgi:uncharacterized protein (DUF1330 family)
MADRKVYMIIDIEAKDAKAYERYTQKVAPIVKRHGGHYLARGGKIIPVSGNWNPKRVVVIEFPSHEAIKQCFSSREYKEIAPLRINSTVSRTILVEGVSASELL